MIVSLIFPELFTGDPLGHRWTVGLTPDVAVNRWRKRVVFIGKGFR
jgi:hypothetical protein